MAGLWTVWKDVVSFTIITKRSDMSISHLHHRMPLILQKEKIDFYLDKNNAFNDFIKFDDMKLKYHQISNLVNSPRNNNANCIEQVH